MSKRSWKMKGKRKKVSQNIPGELRIQKRNLESVWKNALNLKWKTKKST